MQSIRIASVLLLCTGFAIAQHSAGTPPAFAAADQPSSAAPVEPKALHSFDVSAIHKTADPCTDFYAYACGNWRKTNPIPGDQARWGRFNELSERNRYLLYVDLNNAANDPKTPLQKKYGDFYAACMNSDLADQLGDKPVLPALQKIDALSAKDQLAALVATLQVKDATPTFFRFSSEQDQKDSTRQIAGISQGGLTLPDRDYYIVDDARMTKIREQYKAYMVGLF